MRDGLYRVTTARLCAGFVVVGGRVVACAPILRRQLERWRRLAVLVGSVALAECYAPTGPWQSLCGPADTVGWRVFTDTVQDGRWRRLPGDSVPWVEQPHCVQIFQPD